MILFAQTTKEYGNRVLLESREEIFVEIKNDKFSIYLFSFFIRYLYFSLIRLRKITY